MAENQGIFYFADESGQKIPLERMTRAQCEAVIKVMAEELTYWRRLEAMVDALQASEDAAGATIQ